MDPHDPTLISVSNKMLCIHVYTYKTCVWNKIEAIISLTNGNSLFVMGNFDVDGVFKLAQNIYLERIMENKFDVFKFKKGTTN